MTITSEMLMNSLNMFALLAVELTLLFLVISYFVGVLQEYIPPAKIQSILSSKHGKGYVIAALLGAITPFCSCSTIPFLKGLIRAKAGFGAMMVFLFASPLLNPIIIGLFVFTFGWQVAVFYFAIAMGVSVSAGYVLEKLKFERFIRDEAYFDRTKSSCGSSDQNNSRPSPSSRTHSIRTTEECGSNSASMVSSGCGSASVTSVNQNCGGVLALDADVIAPQNKWLRIWDATWVDFKKALPYLLLGIALGSLIYGVIPIEFIAQYADDSNPLAIPVAAVIGIPLYVKAELIIPLSSALTAQGVSLGAMMALIIGSAGASITEVILLKSIFKNPMIIAFLTVVLGMAIMAGFIYRAMF